MDCDRHGDIPHGPYGLLIAEFGLVSATAIYRARYGQPLSLVDWIMLGVATQKIARIIATDRVTSVLRAPVTEQIDTDEGIEESPQGTGMRRALGELLTCPYCLGPWIATALLAGFTAAPQWMRPFVGLFSAVAVADLMHDLTKLAANPPRRGTSPLAETQQGG